MVRPLINTAPDRLQRLRDSLVSVERERERRERDVAGESTGNFVPGIRAVNEWQICRAVDRYGLCGDTLIPEMWNQKLKPSKED